VQYKFVTTKDPEYEGEKELRIETLRKPLGLPPDSIFFPFEDQSYHLIAIEDDRIIGCALFHPKEKTGRLYQMAVEKNYQKQGIGTELVKIMEDFLKEKGFISTYLHARHYAVPFYKRLGYKIQGEPFEEIGIKHFEMRKEIK